MAQVSWLMIGCLTLAQATGGSAAPSNTSQHVIWAVVLLGMAVTLFVTELFVPSGGVIGVLSALCLIGGIVMLFWIDTTVGLIGAIVSVIAVPFAVAGALWAWPNTPIGRALTLGGNDDPEDSNFDGQQPPAAVTHPAALTVGDLGRTITALRPVGTCLFNGKRYECLSDAGVVESDIRVRVISADGMQIKVRPIHDR